MNFRARDRRPLTIERFWLAGSAYFVGVFSVSLWISLSSRKASAGCAGGECPTMIRGCPDALSAAS